MDFFELKAKDISELTDSDLRELVARLCEAELIQQGLSVSNVLWGGAQEAPDGGLDVHVKESEALPKSDFVPRANTGFQVKKNSMAKSACTKEMTANGALKPVIAKLADKKGAYIIVSGKDACSDLMREQRIHGMEAAVSDLKNKNDLFLDFYGSDRLESWLRLHPGVALWARKRLGKPLSGWMPFARWAATPPNQNDDFLSDKHPCVVDTSSSQRESISLTDGIRRTRDKLRAPASIIRIIGLSGVGKTRFTQALFENEVGKDAINSSNVIYADLGVDLTPTPLELVSYLIVNNFSPYVVLDNCPPKVHRDLQNKITQEKARLRLITIEYDISDDQPEETQVIHLESSSEKVVSRLIQRRFPALGAINAQKVAELSAGNPRLAIALASRVDSNETLTKFTDEELFIRLFSQRKGLTDSLLASAEALSLVFSFNISETDFNDEMGVLAKISGIARNTLYRSHAELLRRQLAQSRGNWRAVLPHALANRLAKRALQNIPLTETNKELFKFQNLRLLKSCAHRLSFLHDFGPARDLAKSWMQKGAPLEDITTCGEDLLNVLYYIAPVLPDRVLEAIEDAALNPEFTSRNNGNSHQVVRLLCKLAYDDERFDRAATIILKFAETERKDENNNSIVHLFSQLFSLYLSGTQASPAQRQQFLKRLVTSGNPRHLEIGKKLFDSAFKTSHWIAMESFSFGARIRDFGWEPKTNQERLNWYEGFIDQLRPFLNADQKDIRSWARDMLTSNFFELWSLVGCSTTLEQITREHALGGKWPDLWISIKLTINRESKKSNPALSCLKKLEKLAAPSDPYSEIEAYVFMPSYRYIQASYPRQEEELNRINQKIHQLGELAAYETIYLEKFAYKIWTTDFNSLETFGEGIAKGSSDKQSKFDFLISLMRSQNLKTITPELFAGFIRGVHDKDPNLAQKFQEKVLAIPELKPHFIFILITTPITPWSVNKLIQIACSGELEAWRFRSLVYTQMHESISDLDLAKILSAINELEEGIFTTLDILNMRLPDINSKEKQPDHILLAVGRQTIYKLLGMAKNNNYSQPSLDLISEQCLSITTPKTEIIAIIESLCEAVYSFRFNSFELTYIIETLIRNFPELFLDVVFNISKEKTDIMNLLFRDWFPTRRPILNLIPIDRILKWCNGDEERIQTAAAGISCYTPVGGEENDLESPTCFTISEHALGLLSAAKNKIGIAEFIFKDTFIHATRGSLTHELEVRAKAFAELLEYPSQEVIEFAGKKLINIKKRIRQEKKIDNRSQQRFE